MDDIIASDLHGRLGILDLPKGKVTTPTLVPVLDPKNNIVSAKEMNTKFGFNFIITSAYLFLKRYGMPDGIKSIHEHMSFEGNIMMDSGAYQILAYGDADISPIQSLQIQTDLKTDIGVILDVPTPPTDTYLQAKGKMEETINRIKMSIDFVKKTKEVIWTLPIQGGKNVQLINEYIKEITSRGYLDNFGLHALGSVVPIMAQYDYISLFAMIKEARSLLPHNMPFHLFGAGHPMIFPFIVALGCDTFDSAAYVLYAKEGRYMTTSGTYHLTDLFDFPCPCEICSKWKPKELLGAEEETRIRNLSLHNLYVSSAEIKRIHVALKEGRLWELLELRARSHPYLYKAFRYLTEEIQEDFWEISTPITKQVGLKIYDEKSFYRPELTRARKRILKNYTPRSSNLTILVCSGKKSPLEIINSNIKIRKILKERVENTDYVIFLPFIGVVPIELAETYPFSQFVFSEILTMEIMEKAKEEVNKFITENEYKSITISSIDSVETSEELKILISGLFKESSKNVQLIELAEL
ncbi:MAG: tRNA guanosine(15) transglycosylase TgtA [Candidatus Heimdallarchaeaceae archaeon]|jgi:7-cyano-7-deazaguanine tRNA-ribosyltransferase